MRPETTRSLVLILLCWACMVGAMLAFAPLLPIDETRYIGVAWEMLHSQHWLVPIRNTLPYPDKPPFLFWWLIGVWQVSGVGTAAARIGIALFSLATLGLTARLAAGLWPQRRSVATDAPLVLTGSLLWLLYTPAVMFDIVLSFFVVAAITGVMLAGLGGRPRSGWTLTGLAVGLGILTKGPVAVLFIGSPALLAPLWLPRERSRWHWYAGAAAAFLGGGAIALAWAGPAALAGGADYADAVIWRQFAGRVVHSFDHARAFWWYLPLLPLLLFPWLLWPTGWRSLWAAVRGGDAGTRFVLCWLLPPFVALSLVSGKQPHYLLPLFPAVALLLGRGLAQDAGPRRWRWDGLPVALSVVALALLVLLLPGLAGRYHDLPAWLGELPAWLPPLLLAAAVVAAWPARSARVRLRQLTLTGAAVAVLLVAGVLGTAASRYTVAGAAALLEQAQAEGRPIAHMGATDNRFRFSGRLSGRITELADERALVDWAARNPRGLVVMYYRDRPAVYAATPAPLYAAPYRNKWVAIRPARQIGALAPAPAGLTTGSGRPERG